VGVAACSASSSGQASTATGGTRGALNIAYFASATANGFSDAVWQAMQAEAKRLGGVNLHVLDGNFSGTTQFNQLENAATSKQYNGAVLLANDTVGSVPAAKSLLASGTVVSNVLNPLGAQLDSLSPQVPHLLSVIAAPSYDTTLQAQQVVTYCQGKPDCRVVIFVGGLQYPFDKVRLNAYKSVLAQHQNIHIVAVDQGNYDRNTSLRAMSDTLQAHPKFDVLLSGDQMTEGAYIALRQAGWNVPKMVADGSFFIDSEGATVAGVSAVRAGQWSVVVGNFPATAGKLALDQVVAKLRGRPVNTSINLDQVAPVPLVLTKGVLAKYPSFTGEWSG
jgi:ribose transport system substrate-binding protein